MIEGRSETLSIAVGGDIFPDDYFYEDGTPLNPEFDSTLEVLRSTDLRFGNFETPLSERGRPSEKLITVRSHPKVATDIARLGFDVVSLANNHVCDYGPVALVDTIRTLDGIGIAHVGAGQSLEAAIEPVIFERNGLTVGFIAFTCLIAPGSVATAERPGVAAIRVHTGVEVDPSWQIEEPGEPMMVTLRTRVDDHDCREALRNIRSLRPKVDVLCVSVHWGYGASADLAEYQQPLAHALVDAGADAVLGNHVHDVQGIEMYKGAPVLYSSGTLLGNQIPVDLDTLDETIAKLYAMVSPDGYIARLVFGRTGPCQIEIVPISIDDHGLPIVATDGVFDRIVDRISRHSAKLGTRLTPSQGILVPAP